jgi:hypothetical protein
VPSTAAPHPQNGRGSRIRYTCYPLTQPPAHFADTVIEVFRQSEEQLGTMDLQDGLNSDQVLEIIRPGLVSLGFEVESGKRRASKIHRPVLFGENGQPVVRYEIDAYCPLWRCGLEVEAGRAWLGNAVYRDLVVALVMVDVDWLVLAVPNVYRYRSGGRVVESRDYDNATGVASTLFGHSRVRLPYNLMVVGY